MNDAFNRKVNKLTDCCNLLKLQHDICHATSQLGEDGGTETFFGCLTSAGRMARSLADSHRVTETAVDSRSESLSIYL